MEDEKGRRSRRAQVTLGVYFVALLVGTPLCFWMTLPSTWTRLPATSLERASSELSAKYGKRIEAASKHWRDDDGDDERWHRQEALVDGLDLVLTLCNGLPEPEQALLGWNTSGLEKGLKEVLPTTVDLQITKQVIPCSPSSSPSPDTLGKALSNSNQLPGLLEAAEDMSLNPNGRTAVLYYVVLLVPSSEAGRNAETQLFVDWDDLGGICQYQFSDSDSESDNTGGVFVVDSPEWCRASFAEHMMKKVLYGEHQSLKTPLSGLKKDFDALQRLILVSKAARNMAELAQFARDHFFAPVEERVVHLAQDAILQVEELHQEEEPQQQQRVMKKAYRGITDALHDPSLVETGSVPNLHRIILLCPYFLPLTSVVLRSFLSNLLVTYT